jgi:hypothetical protein
MKRTLPFNCQIFLSLSSWLWCISHFHHFLNMNTRSCSRWVWLPRKIQSSWSGFFVMLQWCRLNDWDLEYDESSQFHCVDPSAEIFPVSINSRSSDNYWNITPWYQQKECEHINWCSNRYAWERTGLEEIDLYRTPHHFIDIRITWPRHILQPFKTSMLSSVASIES